MAPWQTETVTPDELCRRLAFYIDKRCERGRGVQLIDAGVIGRTTLNRWRRWQDPDDPEAGPTRMDVFFRVCLALGDNPGKVIMAAAASQTEACFWRHLHGTYHLVDTITTGNRNGGFTEHSHQLPVF